MQYSTLKRGNSQLKRSYFKRKDPFQAPQMKRGALNRVGRIGRANLKANKQLKVVLSDIDYCELYPVLSEMGVDINGGCLGNFTLANVHRHKRDWYKGDVDLLCDKKQVVKGCSNCHDTIEHDKELTEEVFIKLRGDSSNG